MTEKLQPAVLAAIFEYDPETGSLQRAGIEAGWLERDGYIRVTVDGHQYSAHRLAWALAHGQWPPGEIDHINGIRSDNRLQNLRIATSSQNGANTGIRRDNSSGYKGVGFHKATGRWRARIKVDRKEQTLGYFDTPVAAHEAYIEAAKQLFGDFARAA